MKATVRLRLLEIEAQIFECDDPTIKAAAQTRLENASEQIEATIVEAFTRELKKTLPGLEVVRSGIGEE